MFVISLVIEMSAASDKGGWIGIDLGTTNCTAAVSSMFNYSVHILCIYFYSHLTTIYNNFSVMTYQDQDVKYFVWDIKIWHVLHPMVVVKEERLYRLVCYLLKAIAK